MTAKFVNWIYPQRRVFMQFDSKMAPGVTVSRVVRHAIGLVIGWHFIGWIKAEEPPSPAEGKGVE